jgi:hypothetical protein
LTVEELQNILAGLDPTTLVVINTLGHGVAAGVFPTDDYVEVGIVNGPKNDYHCLVLRTAPWPKQ